MNNPTANIPSMTRDFLRNTGIMGVVTFLPVFRLETVLRPPGATPNFLARGIRCGRCAEACPYDSIRFIGITAGAFLHTPHIDLLEIPCYLCRVGGKHGKNGRSAGFCVAERSAPPGALHRIPNDKNTLSRIEKELKIRTAVLDRRLCLAWQYNFCGECYFACPLKDKALLARPPGEETVSEGIWPHVNPVYCVGCGMCAYVCPVQKNVAESMPQKDSKISYFEERYGALVRRLLDRNGYQAKLPAIRVIRNI